LILFWFPHSKILKNC